MAGEFRKQVTCVIFHGIALQSIAKLTIYNLQEENTTSCLSYQLVEGLMEGVLQVLVVEAQLKGPQLEMSQNKVPQE